MVVVDVLPAGDSWQAVRQRQQAAAEAAQGPRHLSISWGSKTLLQMLGLGRRVLLQQLCVGGWVGPVVGGLTTYPSSWQAFTGSPCLLAGVRAVPQLTCRQQQAPMGLPGPRC